MSTTDILNKLNTDHIPEVNDICDIARDFFKDFMKRSFTDNVKMGVLRKNCIVALISEPNLDLLKNAYKLITDSTFQVYKDEITLFYTLSTMQFTNEDNVRLDELENEIKNITGYITELMMKNIF